jgi:hypothetical protein
MKGKNYVLWIPLDCFEGQHENNSYLISFSYIKSIVKQLFGYAILDFALT